MKSNGWRWAYRKIREWHCTPLTALYRATRYKLLGHSGHFMTHRGMRRSHLRRL